MFRGLTEVTMNKATMIDALQKYFDARIAPGVERNEVRDIKTTFDALGEKFVVTFLQLGENSGA